MKRLFALMCTCLALQGLAQSPPLINYQGAARSANGSPILNQAMGIRFEVLQGSTSGSAVYTETQTVNSNGLGLFSTQIGKNANLGAVNWATGPYFLRVGLDTTGGTAYIALSNPSQLVSVPYALYSEKAGSAPSPTLNFNTSILTVGDQTVVINPPSATPTLVFNSSTNDLSTVGGNTINLPASSTSITGSGAITVNTLVAGSSYNINTPSVTITGGVSLGPTLLSAGILQINGTYPNYTLGAFPYPVYSQTTGSITISNVPGTTPVYSLPPFYATPTLTLVGPQLTSGPASNFVDLSPVAPWRQGAGNTVTLGVVVQQSVGINLQIPTAELHVNGYTRLGNTAPAVQMRKIAPVQQTGGTSGNTTSLSFAGFTTAPKILSVTVLVEGTNGSGNWIPPGYTLSPGLEYNWRINGTNIDVTTSSGNSGSILSKNIQVLVTFEP